MVKLLRETIIYVRLVVQHGKIVYYASQFKVHILPLLMTCPGKFMIKMELLMKEVLRVIVNV